MAHDPGLIAVRLRITPRRPGPQSRKKSDHQAMTTGSIQSGMFSTAQRRIRRQKTPLTLKRWTKDIFLRVILSLEPRTRNATEGKKPCVREECRSWHGPSPACGTLSPQAGRGAIDLAQRKPPHLSNPAQRKLYCPSPPAPGEGAAGG